MSDENLSPEEKAKKWRDHINSLFIEENAVRSDAVTHHSPSGKYKLVVTPYRTGEGTWNYTRGTVYKRQAPNCCDDCWEVIADVKQNYSHFPFGWAEAHPNGHDYLLCCENYQGQTTIELDTGKRVDYLPDRAMQGFGFCWVSRIPSPDRKMLAVHGCYWACPYEIVLFDFSDPMALPYKELVRAEDYGGDIKGWTEHNSITLSKIRTYHKPTSQFTDDPAYWDVNCECDSSWEIEKTHIEEQEWVAEVSTSDLAANKVEWKFLRTTFPK